MTPKRLAVAEKYRQLKAHTEDAGMVVEEKNGKIIVSKRRDLAKSKASKK